MASDKQKKRPDNSGNSQQPNDSQLDGIEATAGRSGTAVTGTKASRWYYSTFGFAAVGAILYWAALPPLNLWPLAWAAPIWWVQLIRLRKLPGLRPYWTLWLIGSAFWLAVLHFLRLPHWATSFGWIALSLYLGIYLPLFIGLSRVAVHRVRAPVWLAAPIVWAGLELMRAHMLTGITAGAIEHTQYRMGALIQLADLFGQYGVAMVMIFVSASIACMLPSEGESGTRRPLALAMVVLLCVIGYGGWRIHETRAIAEAERYSLVRVALIQGSIDVTLPSLPGVYEETMRQYTQLTADAIRENGRQGGGKGIDLIVWPETVWCDPYIVIDGDVVLPANASGTAEEIEAEYNDPIREYAKSLDTDLLLGVGTWHELADGPVRHNSALYVRRDGTFVGRYDKVHLVLFGEYVPFVEQLPFLAPLESLCSATTPGERPACFHTSDKPNNLAISPNICYESFIPHVIRGHVSHLRSHGHEPDVLINLTNDGWFWGSTELDLHLRCSVFRAIENRKPVLIAANTGFSAHIGSDGNIIAQGPRRATGVIIADVQPDGRISLYSRTGDIFAGLCLLACSILAVIGVRRH